MQASSVGVLKGASYAKVTTTDMYTTLRNVVRGPDAVSKF